MWDARCGTVATKQLRAKRLAVLTRAAGIVREDAVNKHGGHPEDQDGVGTWEDPDGLEARALVDNMMRVLAQMTASSEQQDELEAWNQRLQIKLETERSRAASLYIQHMRLQSKLKAERTHMEATEASAADALSLARKA